MVIPRFLLMSTEEREAVLRAYYELEGLIYLENKCAYTAMYLFLKISKWIAKISYEAAKEKRILAPCFNLPCHRTECIIDPTFEDCIIAWLLMGKRRKKAGATEQHIRRDSAVSVGRPVPLIVYSRFKESALHNAP